MHGRSRQIGSPFRHPQPASERLYGESKSKNHSSGQCPIQFPEEESLTSAGTHTSQRLYSNSPRDFTSAGTYISQTQNGLRENSSFQRPFSTSAGLIQRCKNANTVHDVMQIHHCIVDCGLEQRMFVLSSLLQAYCKCGDIHNAHALFAVCSKKTTFMWNSMMAAYIRNGLSHDTLLLWKQMQQEGEIMDSISFATILSSLTCSLFLVQGRIIHSCILYTGLLANVSVATALLNLYGRCGNLYDAYQVFHDMKERDTVAWNCIITVCAHYKMGKEAFQLFQWMQHERILADTVTYISLLSACTTENDFGGGEQVHMHVILMGCEHDAMVGNALLNMYVKCSSFMTALAVFEKMPQRNVVSWNTMIGAYGQQDDGSEAMRLYMEMQKEGILADKVTFICLISACPLCDARWFFDSTAKQDVVLWNAMISSYALHGHYVQGFQLFHQMQLEGFMPNKITYISILALCSKRAVLLEGKQMHVHIFGNRLELDIAVANTLITMYGKCKSLMHAREVFMELLDQSVISWTAMILALLHCRKDEEAVQLFNQMHLEDVLPDEFVFANILDTCTSLTSLREGRRMHTRILARGQPDVVLNTALLNMYCKCGSLEDATQAFILMPEKSTVSWNVMISTLAQHGKGDHALQLLSDMRKEGLVPDTVTLMNILSACSHAGLLSEGFHQFSSLSDDHYITPTVEHYDCLVNLLGRAGQLNQAEYLITNMPFPPTAISFRTLLGASRNQLDLEHGELVANQAFKLEPENIAPCLLLSGILSTFGMGN